MFSVDGWNSSTWPAQRSRQMISTYLLSTTYGLRKYSSVIISLQLAKMQRNEDL